MQKNKKSFFLIAVPISILIMLTFYYYPSIVEVYYGITGNIVEEKVQWNFWTDGRSLEAPGSTKEANKQICLVKASRPLCTFIRAIDNGQDGWDAPINITCTYGCPK